MLAPDLVVGSRRGIVCDGRNLLLAPAKLPGMALALAAFFLAGPSTFNCEQPRRVSTPPSSPMRTAGTSRSPPMSPATAACSKAASTKSNRRWTSRPKQIQTDSWAIEPIASGIRLSIYSSPERRSPRGKLRSNPPLPPRRCPSSTTATVSASPPSSSCRITFAIPEPSTTAYLADRGIAALGSAKMENVELLPGFAGSRIGALAQPPASQRHRQGARTLARARGRADRRHGHRRRSLHRPRHSRRLPALRHLSRPRRLRHERQHPGLRRFLDPPPFAPRRNSRRRCSPSLSASPTPSSPKSAPRFGAPRSCAPSTSARACSIVIAPWSTRSVRRLSALLIFDPRQLFTASFQMTFVCVLIVAAIGIPILQRTSQLYQQALANWDSDDYAAHPPPPVAQFRVDLQFIAARVARFVGQEMVGATGARPTA